MRFNNKTMIITGGSSGIGAATAMLFSREGAEVYVLDKKNLDYAATARIHFLHCDISDIKQVQAAVASILQKIAPIDYLFCNAGIHLFANVEESSVVEIQQVIATNLLGTIYCLQQVLPSMKKQAFGTIVLMASDQAFVAKEQCAIYGATKAAIAQLAKSTALDYAKYGIRVNCVCPGTIDTPMYQAIIAQFEQKTGLAAAVIQEQVAKKLPLHRVGKPDEVAQLVGFLCSEASSFMTGALINIDGGYTIQ
ncbi:MAG: putative oxidoreductase short-chain dehydrogenase/reductase family protein [Pseudomonadota bacterium]|jgi:NAD(P)-dependent dehydrogenase (short-subunit alcohol dehydrogenase family)